jgi:hypothetical protein
MRNGIIHASQKDIFLHVERLEKPQNGFHINLRVGVRFKKVKKEEVISSFSFGIAKNDIGNGDLANPLFKIEGWAIAGKIEELAGSGESGQFLSSKSGFQFVQDQSPDTVHIDPRMKDGKNIRVVHFWQGLFYFKSTDFHFLPSGKDGLYNFIINEYCFPGK